MIKYRVTFKYHKDGFTHPWFAIELYAPSDHKAMEAAHAMLNEKEHELTTCIVEEA